MTSPHPDDRAQPPQPVQPAAGSPARTRAPATIVLIALNVATLLAAAVSASTVAWTTPIDSFTGSATPLHIWGALVIEPTRFTDIGVIVAGVASGEWYRLLTSMFLHFGLLHLAMNMYALFVLGRDLERVYGWRRFTVLYLVAGLGGSVAVYCFSGDGLTAGASGAIFGLFAAMVMLLRKLRMSLASVIPVLVINLALTFAIPGISIAGHLGGLATGAAVGAALAFAPRSRRIRRLTVAGVLAVLVVAVVVRTFQLTG